MFLPSPSPSPAPPLRRLCLSPFGGVQSSRASRATRTLLSDIPGSVDKPSDIPSRRHKSVIISGGVASSSSLSPSSSGVAGARGVQQICARKTRSEPPSSGPEDHPHFFPLSIGHERASAHLPLHRGCLDSLGNRRHTGTHRVPRVENPRGSYAIALPNSEDSSERQFPSVAAAPGNDPLLTIASWCCVRGRER